MIQGYKRHRIESWHLGYHHESPYAKNNTLLLSLGTNVTDDKGRLKTKGTGSLLKQLLPLLFNGRNI